MEPRNFLLRANWGVGSILFSFFLVACSDQASLKVCSDPIGSQNITINTRSINYNNCFFCFKPESISGSDTCFYANCFQLLDSASLPQTIRSIYFFGCPAASAGKIVDVGNVSCLGEVTAKPATGYVYALAPSLNHGYIISFPDGTYGRFFIDSWTQTSDKITVMNIVRQYPF